MSQGELDGLMRQHPHLVHPRQQQQYGLQPSQQQYQMQQQPELPVVHLQQQQSTQQQQPQPPQSQYHQHHSQLPQQPTINITADIHKKHKRPIGGGPYLPQQRSFSSSEEELRSTPDFDGKHVHVFFTIKYFYIVECFVFEKKKTFFFFCINYL